MAAQLTKNILLIDDDECVLLPIARILRLEGYRVDTAKTGKEAIEKSSATSYNLALIDFRLPDMEGTQLLTELRSTTTRMVKIMLTGYPTSQNRAEAFSKDADGFIIKPVRIDVLLKIVREHLMRQDECNERGTARLALSYNGNGFMVVAVGASAGGPKALERVLTKIPDQLPAAFVISQHMPSGFTRTLADRLAALSALPVREAHSGDVLQAGDAFITPGGHNMEIARGGRVRIQKAEQTPSPSIDVMMKSVADVYGSRAIGVLLTGMLTDGVLGMKAIKDHGGVTIVQDESSSVVFGMPKAAIEAGAADVVAHVSNIADRIVNAIVESLTVEN